MLRRAKPAVLYLLTGIFSLAVFLLLLPSTTQAAEQIDSFEASLNIHSDASVRVTEKIEYDFGGKNRHGIFREIPVEYDTNTGDRRIFVDIVSVTRDGKQEPYTVNWVDDRKQIKIGNPNKTITGKHTYRITYTVRGVLNFFTGDRAELYWDIVGTKWEVPIRQASTSISLPDGSGIRARELSIRCFAGSAGATSSCAHTNTTSNPLGMTGRAFGLQPGEAMTVVLNFPANLVTKPTTLRKIRWFLTANPLVLSPLIVFVVGFFIWLLFGKDPRGRGTIVTQYEPPENLKPIMAGALLHEKAQMRDITGGIIYLAEQGYISIEKIANDGWFSSSDYKLKREKSFSSISGDTYRKLATALFLNRENLSISDMISSAVGSLDPAKIEMSESVKLSDLKQDSNFAKTIKGISKDVKQAMKNRGWFTKRSKFFKGVQGVVLLGSFAGVIYLMVAARPSLFGVIGLFLAFAVEILFLSLMQRKTKEGAVLQEKLQGFKRFLSMTQKERLDFHNAPERNPQEFMEYLPYAIAFGVEKKWAQQFEDLDMQEPNWYHTAAAGGFAAGDFAGDMSGMSDAFSTAAGGGSGAGGAGAAGGGAGGGGGGSW